MNREPSILTKKLFDDVNDIILKKDVLKKYFGNSYPYHHGIFRESLLKNLLVEKLNKDFANNTKIRIASGFIYENSELYSKQIDILIFHP